MRKEQPRISNHTEIAKALIEAGKTIKALTKIKVKEEKKKQKGLERLRLLNEEKKRERELMKEFNPNEPKKPRKKKDKPIKKVDLNKVEAKGTYPTPSGGNAPTGTVDLKTLCESLGLDPSKARAKLRKQGVNKPYKWSGSELEDIKKMLK